MKILLNAAMVFATSVFMLACKHGEGIESVPIKLEFTTQASLVEGSQSCGAPPIFHIQLDGEGTGSFVGKFDVSAKLCQNSASGAFIQADPDKFIFIAANGDELHCRYDGDGQFHPTADPTIAEANLAFTILGGTGHFIKAGGGGDAKVVLDKSMGTTTQTWTGRLTWDD